MLAWLRQDQKNDPNGAACAGRSLHFQAMELPKWRSSTLSWLKWWMLGENNFTENQLVARNSLCSCNLFSFPPCADVGLPLYLPQVCLLWLVRIAGTPNSGGPVFIRYHSKEDSPHQTVNQSLTIIFYKSRVFLQIFSFPTCAVTNLPLSSS